MYQETIEKIAGYARQKTDRLNQTPDAYLLLAMMAGAYVGLAVILAYTIGGLYLAQNSSLGPLAMGLSFGGALCLIFFAGAELFTGNIMTMPLGVLKKTVKMGDLFKLWAACYLGNLLGALLISGLFYLTGLTEGPTGDYFVKAAAAKMSAPGMQLFIRGIFCNILVCLAVWTYYRMESEMGKIFMIFWTLLAFVTSGFEHCIANMTIHTVALLIAQKPEVIHLGAALYNLFFATLGNIVGGMVLVGLAYAFVASRE